VHAAVTPQTKLSFSRQYMPKSQLNRASWLFIFQLLSFDDYAMARVKAMSSINKLDIRTIVM
jgi:hypothetical protein